jgi:hypothetical protein
MKTLLITSEFATAQAVTWDSLGKIDLEMIALKCGLFLGAFFLFAVSLKGGFS